MAEIREWKVHLIRNGQSNMGEPTFLYGRTVEEINNLETFGRVIPSNGLISHLSRINLMDELTETGVTILLSRSRPNDDGQKLVQIFSARDEFGRPKHTYASDHPDEEGTMNIHAFCGNSLPKQVWILVKPLDEQILAASLGREWLEGGPHSRQSKIGEFADIDIENSPDWCSSEEENSDSKTDERSIIETLLGSREEDGNYPDFQLPGPSNEILGS
tara:strand:- start:1474 stop:2124 length:651 start_codon:yes stop_codon:yes gene_type:complete